MSKINKFFIGLIIVLVIALAVLIYWQRGGFLEKYYAVYLTTGDIYFGKLSYFPQLSLSETWFLQRNAQDQQNPISLSQFKKVFWGPGDTVYLERKNIIWIAELRSDSSVLGVIKSSQLGSSGTPQSPTVPREQPQVPQPQ